MNAKAAIVAEPDRFGSPNVPLITSQRADLVTLRYDALVQLASGLTGVTLDDVVAHLVARLQGALDVDLLQLVIRDPESALPSVVKRSARRANVWIGEARPRWVSDSQQSLRLGDCDDAVCRAVRHSAGRFPCLSLVLRSAVEGGSRSSRSVVHRDALRSRLLRRGRAIPDRRR